MSLRRRSCRASEPFEGLVGSARRGRHPEEEGGRRRADEGGKGARRDNMVSRGTRSPQSC